VRRPRILRIPAGTIRSMVLHARRARPRECCGLLVGRGARVTFAVPLRNVARGRTRYRVDPRDHIALRRVLRETSRALAIVGVYHSHPRGRAYPSETDVAEALYPEWAHVIVGLGGRRAAVGAFAIARAAVTRLALRRT
jgi:proteasome lid subunit RPN8/RPN11